MSGMIKGVVSYIPGFRKQAPEEKDDVQDTESEKEKKADLTGAGDAPSDEVTSKDEDKTDPEDIKEEDTAELPSNKKTDEVYDPSQEPGYIWRLSSGIYGTAAGAVSYGVGGVKWAAGTGYNAGSVVVGTTKKVISKVPVPTIRRKDKKE